MDPALVSRSFTVLNLRTLLLELIAPTRPLAASTLALSLPRFAPVVRYGHCIYDLLRCFLSLSLYCFLTSNYKSDI